jgi:hypothetical protein
LNTAFDVTNFYVTIMYMNRNYNDYHDMIPELEDLCRTLESRLEYMRSPAALAAATNMVDNSIAHGTRNVSEETRLETITNIVNNGIANTTRQIENTNATIMAIRGIMNTWGANDGNADAVVPNDANNATFQHGGLGASGATKRNKRTVHPRKSKKMQRSSKRAKRSLKNKIR